MAAHGKRAHALLSASGASRWLNCTPSARMEEEFEDKGNSVFAREGTLAHELAELELRKFLGETRPKNYEFDLLRIQDHELYSPEMPEEVEKYTDYVIEQFNTAKLKTPDAVLLLEQKIDLTEFIPDGFGTNDAVIIADGTMWVIDLKYGKGVRVDADENSQLKLYGLGSLDAFDMLYDIHTVKLCIVQPRLDHISEWEISAKDLKAWGEKAVKPKAKLAFEGKGICVAGDHCSWCKAKARCGTIASKAMRVTEHNFKSPNLLKDETLLDIYKQIPLIEDWLKSVHEYLFNEALAGKNWPGYKLVEGRSVRKWKDEKLVIEELSDFEKEKIINEKLKGIGDITKLLGKVAFAERLNDLVIKPAGKPTLVPESDKRPPINSAQNDFADVEI